MNLFRLVLFTFFGLLVQHRTQAQVKTTYVLTQESCKKIAAASIKYAVDNAAPGGSIAIVDAGGHLLYLERMDNTFAQAAEVSYEKARTAALFKKDTKAFEDNINSGRVALTTVGPVMLQGGLLIVYKGEVIGAIGVSGTKSADQDTDVAKVGIAVKLD
ncbi:GlcG/HbpS family heme-binding protein [Spirosoma endbachense]|uniref:Heme-binding protein n=1 Tax=Spirosoma endbachense TaxID=2666025 RepID=A0A6P1W779_9BACT|nr:heme-binding protein [Spirosoma endbachense]QHV99770.1 heme-binding protein [Spirosoma endbachense]